MTSLFDGITKMIGSLVRKSDEPVRFQSGGIVVSPRARIDFCPGFSQGGLVGKPHKEGSEFVIHISAPQFRKVPITGDMAQMCQDLGIEPMPDYVALRDAMLKQIQDSMGVSYKQLIRKNGWAR